MPVRAAELHIVNASGTPIATITTVLDGSVEYLSGADLRDLLDGESVPVRARYRYVAPTRSLTLQFQHGEETTTLRVVAGDPEVHVSGGANLYLQHPAKAGDGDLLLPLDMLVRILPAVLPLHVQLDSGARRLVVSGGARTAVDRVPQATPDAPPADADSQPPNDASYRPLLLRAPAWTGLTVLIDPGHGGVDPGVQQNGVVEKELTLWLAREIVAAAQSAHGRAFLTRVGDQSVTREERWRAVSERQATAFISLHFNSSASPSNSGYRVVVNVSQGPTSGPRTGRSRGAAFESGRLADVLTSALDAAGFTGERLALPLATVPEVAIPAVHLEIAYLSNPEEAALWRNQTVLRAAAGAIWAGLARYRP